MLINYWAIAVAAVASFMFGGLWYSRLSRPWLDALGKTEADLKNSARPMPQLFGMTIVAQLVMAWVLAGLLQHMAKAGIPATPRNGAIAAAFCWLGFIATTLTVNHGYQGARWKLTLIDGAHWLGVLLLQGLILGWIGLRP